MLISDLLVKTWKRFFPKPAIGLSEYIGMLPPTVSYWMRPSNSIQSQQMVYAYLKAVKSALDNGGYIFTKKSRTADLFNQLAEIGVRYRAIHLANMEDIDSILDLENPKELWIIVEDDSLPYETLSSRFTVAEKAVRKSMERHIKLLADSKQLDRQQERIMTVLMFIDVDYPPVVGFTVNQIQFTKLMNVHSCRVSDQRFNSYGISSDLIPSGHNSDEIKSRYANTLRVYGSGLTNMPEMKALICDISDNNSESIQQKAGLSDNEFIHLHRLEEESNIGLSMDFFDARLVDLSK